jgi:hypothetical protein
MQEDFEWHRARFRARRRGIGVSATMVGVIAAGVVIGLALPEGLFLPLSESSHHVRFGLCPRGGGDNCVVDGDTFWLDGRKFASPTLIRPKSTRRVV